MPQPMAGRVPRTSFSPHQAPALLDSRAFSSRGLVVATMSSRLRRNKADPPRHPKPPLEKREDDTNDICRCLCQCQKCATTSESEPETDETDEDSTTESEETEESEESALDESEDTEHAEDYCAELDDLREHLYMLYPDSDTE